MCLLIHLSETIYFNLFIHDHIHTYVPGFKGSNFKFSWVPIIYVENIQFCYKVVSVVVKMNIAWHNFKSAHWCLT